MTKKRSEDASNPFAVLVGWNSTNLGDRMVLRLQGVRTAPPHRPEDIETQEIYLTKIQAAQLGQYLFESSAQTPPQRPSFLARWLRGG